MAGDQRWLAEPLHVLTTTPVPDWLPPDGSVRQSLSAALINVEFETRHWAVGRLSQVAMWTELSPTISAHLPATRSVPSVASVHVWAEVPLQVKT
jgi:hypothetical protein